MFTLSGKSCSQPIFCHIGSESKENVQNLTLLSGVETVREPKSLKWLVRNFHYCLKIKNPSKTRSLKHILLSPNTLYEKCKTKIKSSWVLSKYLQSTTVYILGQ